MHLGQECIWSESHMNEQTWAIPEEMAVVMGISMNSLLIQNVLTQVVSSKWISPSPLQLVVRYFDGKYQLVTLNDNGSLCISSPSSQTSSAIMTVPRDSALDLAEIRNSIGEYFYKKDILACCLVNKEWSLSFKPFLWRTLEIEYPPVLPPRCLENACHIRHLELGEDFPLEALALKGLSRLKTLSLWIADEGREEVVPFLQEQCSTVETLHILHETPDFADYSCLDSAKIYPAITKGCPRLNEITIQAKEVEAEAFREIWDTICMTGVQKVIFKDLVFPRTFFVEQGEVWQPKEQAKVITRIRQLYLDSESNVENVDMGGDRALAMMLVCPELESFQGQFLEAFPSTKFYEAVKAGRWKNLNSISLDLAALSDKELAEVLGSMSSLQELDLFVPSFGEASFKALATHPQGLSCLRILRMDYSSGLNSGHLQTILEGAPRLVELNAWKSMLHGQLFLEGLPWACVSTLKKLCVRVKLTRGDTTGPIPSREDLIHQNQAVFRRLAIMTRLEDLRIETSGNLEPTLNDHIQLTLACGLDQLKSLTRLKEAFFIKSGRALEIEEADWVSRHWPSLEDPGCFVRKDVVIPPALLHRCQERGMKIEQK